MKSIFKNRPALLLQALDDNFLLLISTTTTGRNNPLKQHDKYKIPILNWRETDLRKASWSQAKILIGISRTEVEPLINSDDYIVRIHPEDINFIIEEIERLHS